MRATRRIASEYERERGRGEGDDRMVRPRKRKRGKKCRDIEYGKSCHRLSGGERGLRL